MAQRKITEDNLGAWVIKCDPQQHPRLRHALLAHRPHVVRDWCVADNYRSRMMQPGHRAILWVSAGGGTVTRGIAGVGWVTSEAQGDVSLHLPLLHDTLSDDELRATGIDDLEVQRLPVGSNPSWVSTVQLADIEKLLDGWPEPQG
ncbi:hypothetical protein [Allobranchiibius sp. CTAmp26]|uniref:hypothetical protein n=1 Tax=Allobranchiibius sp. CTAmp26 TaxID=2815214 RepID=UPI001AA0C0FA|nr:hypothetical protein [Allobranchiibius sp. CTAmp26]MBO1756332.1 hypothetical protein [Allobranchiibius sp. CTAmp26]